MLAAGCHVLLAEGIADIEEEVELLKPVAGAPAEGLVALAEEMAAVELAAVGAELEEEVDVAVVIGEVGLTDVAPVAGVGTEDPSPDAPSGSEAYGKGYIDELKPDIAREAVEDAPDEGLLACHAGELAVGTVEPVGHDEESHGDDVAAKIGLDKKESRASAEDDADECDGDGVDVKDTEELCPEVARGTCEEQFEGAFCLVGLHGGPNVIEEFGHVHWRLNRDKVTHLFE